MPEKYHSASKGPFGRKEALDRATAANPIAEPLQTRPADVRQRDPGAPASKNGWAGQLSSRSRLGAEGCVGPNAFEPVELNSLHAFSHN